MSENPSKFIRLADERDWPAIESIYNQCKLHELERELTQFELLPLSIDHARRERLAAADSYLYIMKGKALGFISLRENRIENLYVLKRSRRLGVGRALLEFGLDVYRDQASVSLNVAKSNFVAQQLYQAYGFVTESEFVTEYNGAKAIALSMRREQTAYK